MKGCFKQLFAIIDKVGLTIVEMEIYELDDVKGEGCGGYIIVQYHVVG